MRKLATPPIIVCSQWGARKPKHAPVLVGRPNKIIIHHTDGHAMNDGAGANIGRVSADNYARALQNDMMNNRGWNDSGHNYLVMRSGIILQGRWGSVTAIEHGRMIESAHCPGQNDQPGIEHEHLPDESLTKLQLSATIWLQAWICDRCGIRPTEIYGHNHFYNTDCPSNLAYLVPMLRSAVAKRLILQGRSPVVRHFAATTKRALRAELRS